MESIKGIVLRTVKYGDSNLIIDLFTENHGRISLSSKISHSRRSTSAYAFWQPLSLVECQADIRPAVKLPRPKDVRIYQQYSSIPLSPIKSTIALFLAEFLSAALREEKENPYLFKYIESSLLWLDTTTHPTAIANFHVVFLMRMTQFLGFYPNLDDTDSLSVFANAPWHRGSAAPSPMLVFDLVAGTYTKTQPPHPHFVRADEARLMPWLFRLTFRTMHLFRMSSTQRKRCMEILNQYYRLHLPNFPELKSIEVLHEVFGS